MYKITSFILLVCLFTACKPSRQQLLLGKWKAVSMTSPQLTQEIADTKTFIDTVGRSTTPEENEMLYGVRNMDSLRATMKEEFNATIKDQERMIQNTSLDFYSKDEVASNFGNGQDTIGWFIDDDGALILDEMKKKGGGSKVTMEIVKLEADSLHLRFNEGGYSSTAIFIKAK